jgi:two-component system chemotaxis sensor kinase CheA
VSGLALIGALIVAGLVAGWLSRPVRRLADAVEAVGRGAFAGIPARIDGGPAEIAYLTNAVRSMVDSVRARGQELQQLNATLEQKVEQRTEELTRNNRDMRLVLDNVAQGLLTVDGEGRLTEQRSAIVDRWFGAYVTGTTFADYTGAVDPKFGAAFQLAHEAYMEGFLPPALCIEQLPTRLRGAAREFRCSYSSLDDRPGGALLIVIDDVTQQLLAAEKDAEQRDLMALLRGVTRDRSGYVSHFEEGDRIVAGLAQPGAELTVVKRLLHTLKGNAGLADLRVLADLCHRAEDEIEAACAITTGGSLAQVHAHWQVLRRALHDLLGTHDSGMVEVNPIEIEHLRRAIRDGAPAPAVIEALAYLQLDPVEPPFGRLAKYARTLGPRLNKGDVATEIDARGVRVNAQRWRPLWTELIHVVRNAIDHGFETPDERRALGKGAPRLRFAAAVQHGTFRLEIEDDGRGIDWAEIKRAALARGLPAETQADLVAALLAPGFSTRGDVTATSGRGMGLSAVLARVRELGGTIHVESQRLRGTRWSLSFPASSPAGVEAMAAPALVLGLRASGLDHPLPAERPEGVGAGGRVGIGVDGQLQPLERERAAVHDDAMEVLDAVARVHEVQRIRQG